MFRKIFNLWRDFKREHPKDTGWYLCTVEVNRQQRYVMNLYWKNGKFKDNIRQDMLDCYHVYKEDPYKTHDITGLNTSILRLTAFNSPKLIDKTNSVVAWKKLPRAYMKGFKKDEFYIAFQKD